MADSASSRRIDKPAERPTGKPAELDEVLLARVRAGGDASDAKRNPNRGVLVEMGRRGLMRMLVPEELGGLGRHPAEFIEFTHRVSYEHPSAGWVAMTCNEEAEIFAAHLEHETVSGFYAMHPDVVIAGSGVPRGIARPVDGGWKVNGRWTFVSGCTGADWWVVANVVDGTLPKQVCHVLVPADQACVEDTWHTVGLRGTGSHDVVLTDLFVPNDRAAVVENYSLPKPNEHPFYRLPSGLRFPFPKTGVASGIARRAIDEFAALADTKTPLFARSELVARAEALLGAGRAFVADQLDRLWETASAGGEITPQQHARARLACSWSVQNCIAAVETLVTAAGSTANFTASPLGALLNDVRAVAGHFMVGSYQMDTAGRVLLGQDSGDRNF